MIKQISPCVSTIYSRTISLYIPVFDPEFRLQGFGGYPALHPLRHAI